MQHPPYERRTLSAYFYEAAKYRNALFPHVLRVPLNAVDGQSFVLQSLHSSVGSFLGDCQIFAQAFHRLVMGTVDFVIFFVEIVDPGVFSYISDCVPAASVIFNVLIQGTSKVDVDQLHSTTDAKDRLFCFHIDTVSGGGLFQRNYAGVGCFPGYLLGGVPQCQGRAGTCRKGHFLIRQK